MRKFLTTAAVGAGLLGTAFLGGAAISAIAGAQDEAPPTTEAPAPEEAPEPGAGRWGRHPGAFGAGCHGLDGAAEALGLTADELGDALAEGQTLADIAAANDVEVSTLVDAMVADAQARLDEAVAAGDLTPDEAADKLARIRERTEAMVNGDAGPFGPHPFGDREGFDGPPRFGPPEAEGSVFVGPPVAPGEA